MNAFLDVFHVYFVKYILRYDVYIFDALGICNYPRNVSDAWASLYVYPFEGDSRNYKIAVFLLIAGYIFERYKRAWRATPPKNVCARFFKNAYVNQTVTEMF